MALRQQENSSKTGKIEHETVPRPITTSPERNSHPLSPSVKELRRPNLIARMAVAGLTQTDLPFDQRAEFYEGVSALLPVASAEAALYAAMCIRESQRAQREFLAVMEIGNRDGLK